MAINGGGGEQVLLDPGTYPPVDSTLAAKGIVAPRVPGTRPTIQLGSGGLMQTTMSGHLQDLRINAFSLAPSSPALEMNTSTTASRVIVVAGGGSGAIGAWISGFPLLEDSVVVNTASAGTSVRTLSGGGQLDNVTAIATGPGSLGLHADTNDQSTNVLNSILRGTAFDLRATAGTNVNVNLGYSDFVTSDDTDGAGTGAVIDTSAGGNITGTPLFRNAAGGDYRQCPGSPTINAGTNTGVSLTALDGQARIIDGTADIGADEFSGAPCPTAPPVTSTPAATTPATATPKKKCKKGRKLKKGKCVRKKRKK